MSDHLLAGVVVKLRRADGHLETLYNETAAYMNSASQRIIPKDDAGDGHPGFVYSVDKQPPAHFPALIGDILHNERCALDYIAHALVRLNGETPTERTQFPVFRSKAGFEKETTTPDRAKGIARFPLRMIGAFQPFQLEGDKCLTHPLWILRVLSNLDKHRQPTVSAMGMRCRWSYRDVTGVRRSGSSDGPVYDGAVLAQFPGIDKANAKMEIKSSLTVAFRNHPAEGLEVLNTLQSIREFIGDLMFVEFAKLFDPIPEDLKLGPNRLTGLSVPKEL